MPAPTAMRYRPSCPSSRPSADRNGRSQPGFPPDRGLGSHPVDKPHILGPVLAPYPSQAKTLVLPALLKTQTETALCSVHCAREVVMISDRVASEAYANHLTRISRNSMCSQDFDLLGASTEMV